VDQDPYDARHTTISLYDAGMMPAHLATHYPWRVQSYKEVAVCSLFIGSQARAGAQIAPVGSGQAVNVYINTAPNVLPFVTQGTVFHETLHNLTGLTDFLPLNLRSGTSAPFDLKTFVGVETTPGVNPSQGSTDITEKLKEEGCVPN
jgi:hypothetical protein